MVAIGLLSARRFYVAVLALCLVAEFAQAETLQVTISDGGNVNANAPYYYYKKLLELALGKTRENYGDFNISSIQSGGIERERAMLVAGVGIDVMWASVTRERAEKLRVIDIDLLKNLNNYRVLLINQQDQFLFDSIASLDDLKKMHTGSGPHWTDGIILKDNGFNITYTSSYEGLFKMLAAQRFHFISRGLHEIGNDLELYSAYGLVQEKNLLLKYDQPVRYCFFVNKNNKILAERIERGLKIAQADGSFDRLFYQMPSFTLGENILLNSHRTILELKNRTDQ